MATDPPSPRTMVKTETPNSTDPYMNSYNVPRLVENSPYQANSTNSVHNDTFIRRPSNSPTPPQLPTLQSPSYSRQRTPVTEATPTTESPAPSAQNNANGYRPLNVKDALTYLDQVKVKFSEQPEVYNRFLDIMKEFKSQAIDTPGVIERVSTLFRGHPTLISGFNTFLPPGYRIECSTDADARDVIKVTTPTGTTSTMNGEPLHLQSDLDRYYHRPHEQPPFQPFRPPLPPISYPLHIPTRPLPVPPVLTSPDDTNPTRRAPVEFNHAINYVNKIKNRFSNDPDTYKQFLEILQTYQKEQKPIQEVYGQVQALFQGANDLLAEFKQFLPEEPIKKPKKRGALPALPKQKKPKTVHPPKPDEVGQEPEEELSLGETEFFERCKRCMTGKNYLAFVKVLHLFSQQVVDTNSLIDQCQPFLQGHKDLMDQLKVLVGYDGQDRLIDNVPVLPLVDLTQAEGGPSYRCLPKSYQTQSCSGRDSLCWEVLNDNYVSQPTYLKEEVASKKNLFEEALHRVEDERYVYDIQIESNLNTIALLEPIAKKMNTMTEEEKVNFKLSPGLGGPSKAIYQRVIKKIYGKEQGNQIIEKLHNQPSQTVPIILKRLRQKDEEWRRSQRGWNKVWREIEIQNYYKALDYQGVIFKTNDRKMMTVKKLVQEIESIRLDQQQQNSSMSCGEPQFSLPFKSKRVFKDVSRILYSYFERQTMYGHEDCEIMKAFIEMFLPVFFDVPDVLPDLPNEQKVNEEGSCVEEEEDDMLEEIEDEMEDNQTTFDETHRSRRSYYPRRTGRRSPRHKPNEEDPKLLKDVLTKSIKSTPHDKLKKQQIQLEDDADDECIDLNKEQKIYNFLGNTTFYCFFRLFQICYDRLYKIKQIDKSYRLHGEKAKSKNKAKLELNVTSVTFNSIEMDFRQGYYKALLKLIDRYFDDEFDQHVFEECTRYLFGTKAYILFTIDKLMLSIMRQLHQIVTDPKAQELLSFFKKNHEYEKPTSELTKAYRNEVTGSLGENDNVYNLAFDTLNRTLSIQLLEKEDETFELNDMDRYTEYVSNYMNWHKDTPHLNRKKMKPTYLKRNLNLKQEDTIVQSNLEYKICSSTSHLFYISGTEDVILKTKNKSETLTHSTNSFKLSLDKGYDTTELDKKTRSLFT